MLESVLKGLDENFRSNSFNQFYNKLIESDTTPQNPLRPTRIIFIDSLDENQYAEDWFKVTKILGEFGFLVVWACRKLDWDTKNLTESIIGLNDEDKSELQKRYTTDVRFGLKLL